MFLKDKRGRINQLPCPEQRSKSTRQTFPHPPLFSPHVDETPQTKKCAFPFKKPPPFAERREEEQVSGTATEKEKKKNPTADGFKSPQ